MINKNFIKLTFVFVLTASTGSEAMATNKAELAKNVINALIFASEVAPIVSEVAPIVSETVPAVSPCIEQLQPSEGESEEAVNPDITEHSIQNILNQILTTEDDRRIWAELSQESFFCQYSMLRPESAPRASELLSDFIGKRFCAELIDTVDAGINQEIKKYSNLSRRQQVNKLREIRSEKYFEMAFQQEN